MRVLIVASYNRGFFTAFVIEQAKALQAAGVEVDYFGIAGAGWTGYLSMRGDLLRKIQSFKPDIIHAHYGLSGALACLQSKVPVVTTFHNGETHHWRTNLISSFFSMRAKHTIYVAQHIRDLVYFKPRHYSILPCGVNANPKQIVPYEQAREQLGFLPDKKYIIFGGAFDNLRKNYPLLHEAIQLTGRTDIEVIEMKDLTREQITLRMCACDLFALPTKNEGSPQALKEAMTCNCPIIATDVADIKHLLGDVAGHYICSFNPQEVAQTLQQALAYQGRTQGLKRIQELGLDNVQVAQRLIDIYNRVLQ